MFKHRLGDMVTVRRGASPSGLRGALGAGFRPAPGPDGNPARSLKACSTRGSRRRLAIFFAIAFVATGAEPFRLHIESPQPARFYLTDSAGRLWTPEGAIAYSRGGEQHF